MFHFRIQTRICIQTRCSTYGRRVKGREKKQAIEKETEEIKQENPPSVSHKEGIHTNRKTSIRFKRSDSGISLTRVCVHVMHSGRIQASCARHRWRDLHIYLWYEGRGWGGGDFVSSRLHFNVSIISTSSSVPLSQVQDERRDVLRAAGLASYHVERGRGRQWFERRVTTKSRRSS